MHRLIPLESFNHTGLPVLAVDTDGMVCFYNRAAAELLGRDMTEGLGRRCWKLARLRSRDGTPFCARDCPVQCEARTHRLHEEREVCFLSKSGDPVFLHLITFLMPPMLHDGWAILHLLKPMSASARLESSPLHTPAGATPTLRSPPGVLHDPMIGRLHLLSTREREVMQALVEGLDVTDMSNTLHISPATVRNHIHNILRKLHLHRQVDAILAVMRQESPGLTIPPPQIVPPVPARSFSEKR